MTGKGPERTEISAPSGAITFGKHLSVAEEHKSQKKKRMRSLEGTEAESWWSFSRTMRDVRLALSSPMPSRSQKKSGFEMKWNFNQCGLLEEVLWVCYDDAGVIRGSNSWKPFKARIEMWVSKTASLMEDLKAVNRQCFEWKTLKEAVTMAARATLVRASENKFQGSSFYCRHWHITLW